MINAQCLCVADAQCLCGKHTVSLWQTHSVSVWKTHVARRAGDGRCVRGQLQPRRVHQCPLPTHKIAILPLQGENQTNLDFWVLGFRRLIIKLPPLGPQGLEIPTSPNFAPETPPAMIQGLESNKNLIDITKNPGKATLGHCSGLRNQREKTGGRNAAGGNARRLLRA